MSNLLRHLGFESNEAAIGANLILRDNTEVNIIGVVQGLQFYDPVYGDKAYAIAIQPG